MPDRMKYATKVIFFSKKTRWKTSFFLYIILFTYKLYTVQQMQIPPTGGIKFIHFAHYLKYTRMRVILYILLSFFLTQRKEVPKTPKPTQRGDNKQPQSIDLPCVGWRQNADTMQTEQTLCPSLFKLIHQRVDVLVVREVLWREKIFPSPPKEG
ncbi:MAG TPA: hypothetical protein DIW30_06905 [Bacteroidales bacterium]|nr:hypothetical protein [Bacteroidales bacterium]